MLNFNRDNPKAADKPAREAAVSVCAGAAGCASRQ